MSVGFCFFEIHSHFFFYLVGFFNFQFSYFVYMNYNNLGEHPCQWTEFAPATALCFFLGGRTFLAFESSNTQSLSIFPPESCSCGGCSHFLADVLLGRQLNYATASARGGSSSMGGLWGGGRQPMVVAGPEMQNIWSDSMRLCKYLSVESKFLKIFFLNFGVSVLRMGMTIH